MERMPPETLPGDVLFDTILDTVAQYARENPHLSLTELAGLEVPA